MGAEGGEAPCRPLKTAAKVPPNAGDPDDEAAVAVARLWRGPQVRQRRAPPGPVTT